MIYSLRGTVLEKGEGEAVIECAGVGYRVLLPGPAAGALPAVGSEGRLYTVMAVSENDVSLFGFSQSEERRLFLMLTSVSGVGPRMGIAILSALSVEALVLAISAGDTKALTAASGVGPKLAQRIVLELRDKVAKTSFPAAVDAGVLAPPAGAMTSDAGQAVAALVALGYTQSEAAAAVSRVDGGLPVAEMVRLALKSMGAG